MRETKTGWDATAREMAGCLKLIVDPLDASDFVALADVLPAVIQEIRYYSAYNFVGTRIRGYEEPCALVTRETAEALAWIVRRLESRGYLLKVYDAYRPQTAVNHFIEWSADLQDTRMKADFYPMLSKAVLFDQGYILARSGHSRGSTLDLTLVDARTGRDIDMGSTFDLFSERSHPAFRGDLTETQVSHRALLRDVMLEGGFDPIETEWWHFTLRDEPYPDTYFDFPVRHAVVEKG